MKILALELSSGQGSLAFVSAHETASVRFENDRKHSGRFFRELVTQTEKFGMPERIVVGLGPGSYAGTRIAIAAAIGIQAATGAELFGLASVCGLEVTETDYVVIGDARRESFWHASLHEHECVEGPTLMSRDELCQRLETSDLAVFSSEILPAFPRARLIYPSAMILARLAERDSSQLVRASLEPLYLREPHITQPKS
jgi:tRNA threonylcarbamoyladenosine biosynthesis protein TsaB